LRRHVRERTVLGQQAQSYMDAGQLVPDGLMIDVLMDDAASYLEDGGTSLLLDGFPRNLSQAVALDQVARIGLVVNLDIPTETIVERIADRWIHPPSGRIYSYSYHPPQRRGYDDATGEPLIQREDDKPESVRTRLRAYDAVTAPLVQYYTQRGVLKTFTGTMSDVIYPQVKLWLQEQHFS
jgi:nucleoside-triphosphate--adenylate kinase